MREIRMTDEVLHDRWHEVRGNAPEWWGKLTDDDLDAVNGRTERLVGLLQERYGHARDGAEREVKRRVASLSSHIVRAPRIV